MYFIGDVHGIGPLVQIIIKRGLKDSNLIQVGDLGLGFQEITRDISNLKNLDEILLENNLQLFACRGNHDNPIFWDKSKGLNLPKLHNIHLVDDYSVLDIENKKILCVGGGISIDRQLRKDDRPYPSWWQDEEFQWHPGKFNRVVNNHSTMDIVVTHSAPSACYPRGVDAPIVNDWHNVELQHGNNLKGELQMERKKIDMLKDAILQAYKPTNWFYGHFHTSKTEIIDLVKFQALNINEICEI